MPYHTKVKRMYEEVKGDAAPLDANPTAANPTAVNPTAANPTAVNPPAVNTIKRRIGDHRSVFLTGAPFCLTNNKDFQRQVNEVYKFNKICQS